ncbi:hypothetical protein ACE1SV_60540 [Streptomyces sp. E-15]
MTVQDIDRVGFVEAWQEWHRAKEEVLAGPHGFLAVTGLHWLGPEPERFEDAPGAQALSSNSRLLRDAMHAPPLPQGRGRCPHSPHRAPTRVRPVRGTGPGTPPAFGRGDPPEHASDAARPALRADGGILTTGPGPRPPTAWWWNWPGARN